MGKKAVLAIILIVILSVTAVVVASYIMTSNSINVPTTTQATLSLTVNGTTTLSAIQYENVTLRTVCSDAAYTGTVTFKDGGYTIGTNSSVAGIAYFQVNLTQAKVYAFSAEGSHN